MEEAEKTVALKKAYADIILNTAKEAAARIMAAERKALRFQQDLRSTKDEALRMLISLKQMIDAKTTESEITSLSQQRRIEDLEAQLNEAEGTIINLRAELEQAQDQLDKVKDNHLQHLNGLIEKEEVPSYLKITHEKKLSISEPFISSPCQFSKCCNSAKQAAISNSHSDNTPFDDANLASVIMKSKEPELYRNGCTQRIRAIEMNLLDENFLPEDVIDQQFLIKGESVINGNEQNIGTCTIPSTKNEYMDIMKTSVESKVVCVNTSAAKDQPVKKVCKKPRRKWRHGTSKASSCKPSLAFSHRRSISDTGDNKGNSSEGVCTLPTTKSEKMNFVENSSELEENLPNNNDQAACILRRSIRKRKVRYRDDIATSYRSLPNQFTESYQPCPSFSRCKTYSVNRNVKSGEGRLKTESGAEIQKGTVSILVSRDVNVDTKVDRDSGHTQSATDKDTELDESTLVKQEVLTRNLNLKVDSESLTDFDSRDAKTSEVTNGAPCHADSKRLLKYTFSRKRKKESLTNLEKSSSFGNSSVGEKLNISSELQNSSLINESSRDSRRLVLVARQLISLSGKTWG